MVLERPRIQGRFREIAKVAMSALTPAPRIDNLVVPDDGKRVGRENKCCQRDPHRNGEFGGHEPAFNLQRSIAVCAPENRNEQEPNAVLHQEQ